MSIDLVSCITQHRAQVCSVLGEHGVEVPGLDYEMHIGLIRAGHTQELGSHAVYWRSMPRAMLRLWTSSGPSAR
jgi:hypothetical protein